MRQKSNYSIGVTYIDCFYNKAIGIFMTYFSSSYICITAVHSTCSKSVGKMLEKGFFIGFFEIFIVTLIKKVAICLNTL